MGLEINIKDFNNIDEINVELSKFMIFYGKNSSGKTRVIKLLKRIYDSLLDISSVYNEITNGEIESIDLAIYNDLRNLIIADIEKKLDISIKDYKEISLLDMMNRVELDEIWGQKNILDTKSIDRQIFDRLDELYEIQINSNKGNWNEEITGSREDIDIEINMNNHVDWDINVSYQILKPKVTDFEMYSKTYIGDCPLVLFINEHPNIIGSIKSLGYSLKDKRIPQNRKIYQIYEMITHSKLSILDLNLEKIIYLPASMEVYTRDYLKFLNTYLQNQDEDIHSMFEGARNSSHRKLDLIKKRPNVYSRDNFVEEYVKTYLQALSSSGLEQDIVVENNLKYLEEDILGVKVIADNNKLVYKLKSGEQIDTIHASSLINEYSSLYTIFNYGMNKSFIVEEPESHLATENIEKMTCFLLLMYGTGYNFWITTHNTIVTDTINNIILLNKIADKNKQKELVNSLKLNEGLIFNRDIIDDVKGYYIGENTFTEIEKTNKDGLIFDDFINQMENFMETSISIRECIYEQE